ncbi:hypothetical protein M9H77_08731 [Catharanthus roseus]|uniref:Uncharacterized protein n=1 Tax=Catharanthus roseus TaxID=4058 RepID=A0ACC0BYS7_CATRO|nr:hypothetical protein M9H77_08731 [Catharanthus roseus]
MKNGLIVELNNEGSNQVEEISSNKGNINNEDCGKKPRVGVEISDCSIVGDLGLRKSINSDPYEIRDELRRRLSTTLASISSALIELFYPVSATAYGTRYSSLKF